MAFGLGVLRLSSAAFWKMTLVELAAAVRGLMPARDGLKREQLSELMQRFPDRSI
jgi:uncharacterized phage protein (TIGR02216 family)